jgi:hypothetical protein
MQNRLLIRWAPLWIGLAALAFYLPGLARQPLPNDSSIYISNAVNLSLNSYAQTHPLFLAAGHAFLKFTPILHIPAALSLMAAVFAAVAVAFVFATVRRLGCGALDAAVAAAALAVAHAMWYHALFPEVYSMNAMFMAGMLYFVVRWYNHPADALAGNGRRKVPAAAFLGAGAFLGALGCANHLLVGMSLAVVALWALFVTVRERRRLSDLLWAAAAGCAGCSFLGWLFLHDAARLGLATAFRMLLAGGGGIRGESLISYSGHMFQLSPERLAIQSSLTVAMLLFNFAGPQLLLLGLGVGQLKKYGRLAFLLAVLFAVHVIFPATYAFPDFWVFLLPAWVVAAIVVGLGVQRFRAQWCQRWRFATNTYIGVVLTALTVSLPVMGYWLAPKVLAAVYQPAPEEMARQGKVAGAFAHYQSYLWPPKNRPDQTTLWMRQALGDLPEKSTLMLRPALFALACYLQEFENIAPELHVTGNSRRLMAKWLHEGRTVYTDNLTLLPGLRKMGLDPQVSRSNGFWKIAPKAVVPIPEK